jgi:hypothetical protein
LAAILLAIGNLSPFKHDWTMRMEKKALKLVCIVAWKSVSIEQEHKMFQNVCITGVLTSFSALYSTQCSAMGMKQHPSCSHQRRATQSRDGLANNLYWSPDIQTCTGSSFGATGSSLTTGSSSTVLIPASSRLA